MHKESLAAVPMYVREQENQPLVELSIQENIQDYSLPNDSQGEEYHECYINLLSKQLKIIRDLDQLWSLFEGMAAEPDTLPKPDIAKIFDYNAEFFCGLVSQKSIKHLRWLIYEILHHKDDTG